MAHKTAAPAAAPTAPAAATSATLPDCLAGKDSLAGASQVLENNKLALGYFLGAKIQKEMQAKACMRLVCSLAFGETTFQKIRAEFGKTVRSQGAVALLTILEKVIMKG